MLIETATDRDAEDLYVAYVNATAPLVHGFAATESEFVVSFRAAPRHLRDYTVLTCRGSDGRVAGFARVGTFRPIADRWSFGCPGDGMLFGPFVTARDGAADAGEALLQAAREWLVARGAARAHAFDPVEASAAPYYNGGWCGLSERMPRVLGLYMRCGFRIEHRELCLTRPELPVAVPPEPPGRLTLTLEMRDRGRSALRIWDRGASAGTCFFSRMHPARSARPQAFEAGYIDGLTVAEPYRGRGLGRLLMLNALYRLNELGCRTVSLTTAGNNLRAQNLYYSLGFALMDSCVSLAGPVRTRELVRVG